jgi:hypothetical protein
MRAPMRPVVLAFTLLASLSHLSSCASHGGGTDRPVTTLVVDNKSSFEMTIYVLRGSERVRLGTARPIAESRLRLPPDIVFGATSLRFQADPIGARGAPISSEILVREGDEVHLRIPPP